MSLRTLPLATGASAAADREVRRHPEIAVSLVFIGTGVTGLVAAAVLLILWGAELVTPGAWALPHALALTHVLALGFVTAIALGVLYHIAPLAFGHALPHPWIGLVVWLAYTAGLGVFLVGMARMDTGDIVAGAFPMGSAIAAAGAHLGTVALRARRRFAPSLFQLVAVAALVVVAGLGVTLAVQLHAGAGTGFLTLLGAKVTVAVGGWLGMLVVGVSYQLVPMFTPSRVRLRLLRTVLALLAGGVTTSAAAILLGAPPWMRGVLSVPYVAGAALHCAEVLRLVAHRRDRGTGPVTVGQVLGAVLLLGGAVEGAIAMGGDPRWAELAVATALLGWTPVLIAANSVRIIPFIVWQGMPRGHRPRTFAPAHDALVWGGVASAAGCWLATTSAVLAHSGLAAGVAGALLLLCAVAVAAISTTALWRTRRV